jgi:hypothetical protein
VVLTALALWWWAERSDLVISDDDQR